MALYFSSLAQLPAIRSGNDLKARRKWEPSSTTHVRGSRVEPFSWQKRSSEMTTLKRMSKSRAPTLSSMPFGRSRAGGRLRRQPKNKVSHCCRESAETYDPTVTRREYSRCDEERHGRRRS